MLDDEALIGKPREARKLCPPGELISSTLRNERSEASQFAFVISKSESQTTLYLVLNADTRRRHLCLPMQIDSTRVISGDCTRRQILRPFT